ncbi:MAG: ABC transporter permease, partial [Planctomycetota bacterium]
MKGPIELTPVDLAVAALLLLIPAAISIALRLGLGRRLLLGGIRSVLQLGFLGLVLDWVFELDRWYLVVPLLLFMVGAAARAAVARSSREIPGVRWLSMGALVLATSVVAFTSTELVV